MVDFWTDERNRITAGVASWAIALDFVLFDGLELASKGAVGFKVAADFSYRCSAVMIAEEV